MICVLRDYQESAVNVIWNKLLTQDTALCAASTGGGKTEIFIEFIRRAIENKPDVKFCVLVQKITLAEQTIRRFKEVFKSVSVYSASISRDLSAQIIIATIQSISNIKIDGLNCIIIDEVHNADFEEGRYSNFIRINNHAKLKLVGFTATPFKSTGYIYGEDKIFKSLDFNITLPELISRGYLVTPRMKRVDHQFDVDGLRVRAGEFVQEDVSKLTGDQSKIESQIDDALSRVGDRSSIVWACASIKHCEDVCRIINSRGHAALALHSDMTKELREISQRRFESGKIKHLVFVSIISEGYDHPPIDCIVLMRPIRSPVLYIQTVGRGLRPSENKYDCLVLDYGKVVETLGPIDKPLVSSRGRSRASPNPMKFCPACLEYVAIQTTTCPVCNHEFKRKEDPTKSLTRRPGEFNILSGGAPKEITMGVSSVQLGRHVSKNGNECLKIDYISDGLVPSVVSEFFIFNGVEWAYKKMQKRLLELDVELKGSLAQQSTENVGRVPTSIIYTLEDRYPRIRRLVF